MFQLMNGLCFTPLVLRVHRNRLWVWEARGPWTGSEDGFLQCERMHPAASGPPAGEGKFTPFIHVKVNPMWASAIYIFIAYLEIVIKMSCLFYKIMHILNDRLQAVEQHLAQKCLSCKWVCLRAKKYSDTNLNATVQMNSWYEVM